MTFWQKILTAIRDGTGDATLGGPPKHMQVLQIVQSLKVLSFEDGKVSCAWAPPADFATPPGFIFGGYTAAITDTAADFVMMTYLQDGETYATADLRVSYFKQIFPGTYRIEGRAVVRTKRSAHIEIDFIDADGNLCAKSTVMERVRPVAKAG